MIGADLSFGKLSRKRIFGVALDGFNHFDSDSHDLDVNNFELHNSRIVLFVSMAMV